MRLSTSILSLGLAVFTFVFFESFSKNVSAAENAFSIGTRWTVNIDGLRNVMRMRKVTNKSRYSYTLELAMQNGFAEIEVPTNRSRRDFRLFISNRNYGKAECYGKSPRNKSFVSGACNDGRLFIMTPTRTMNKRPKRRFNRVTARQFAGVANQLMRSTPVKRQGVNVDRTDFWVEKLVDEQKSIISRLFSNDARGDIEREIRADCTVRCLAIHYNRIISEGLKRLQEFL